MPRRLKQSEQVSVANLCHSFGFLRTMKFKIGQVLGEQLEHTGQFRGSTTDVVF